MDIPVYKVRVDIPVYKVRVDNPVYKVRVDNPVYKVRSSKLKEYASVFYSVIIVNYSLPNHKTWEKYV